MRSISNQSPTTLLTYSLVWGWLHIANQRFEPMSTGQMLTAMTIIMLHDLGYEPTVSDLTRLTRMPKSSVSRYVSREMELGFLEEYVDPADRRQRRLRATSDAQPELARQCELIQELFEFVRLHSNGDRQKHGTFIDELEQKLVSVGERI